MLSIAKKTMRMLLIEKSQEDLSIKRYFSSPNNNTLDSALGITYQFKKTSNFDEALSLFNSFHPDLILVNLVGSLSEVMTLCKEVRKSQDTRHTGIVIVQGASLIQADTVARCLEAGADDFIERKATPREIAARVHAVFRFKITYDELRSANHQLMLQSLTDDLTGLHNMRSFTQEYSKLFSRSQLTKSGFGILMLDLDRFKSVNDTTNHLVGSYVISEVGKIINKSTLVYKDTVPARYGGDEYIICQGSDNPQEIMALGELIRSNIENRVFSFDNEKIKLTASVGFSWMPSGYEGSQDVPIKAADLMLYRSKEKGRNQVRGMMLRNAVDFDHVSRLHLVDGDTSSNYNDVPRVSNIKFF